MGGRGASAYERVGYRNSLVINERKIRGKQTESAIVIDKSGRIVFIQSTGESDAVHFTEDQLKNMKGTTLTHNHPRSSTFSSEDLYLLTKQKLKAIRAVGDHHTYQLEKMNTTPLKDRSLFASDYKAAMVRNKAITNKLYNKYHDQMKSGIISISKFNGKMVELETMLNKLNSDWLRANAKDYGYRYGISRRK
jgi:NAD+--asparagine ADP-ribosyltransferase